MHVETIWEETIKIKEKNIGKNKFLAEIGWREFGHSLINYFPHMIKGNYSKKFNNFPWKKNDKLLKSWKEGLTGYPIVDAGMRELYKTGWMHNRVRMIVGSFLVKHLLIHWREGKKVICRDWIKNLLMDLSETAENLNMTQLLKPIFKVLEEGNQSMNWIKQYKEGLSIEDIMKCTIRDMIKTEEESI